jgi:hypothetical protein
VPRLALLVLSPVLSLALLTGCGGSDDTPASRAGATDRAAGTAAPEPTPTDPEAGARLSFRGSFDVEDGVWFLGVSILEAPQDPTAGQRNGLLGASGGNFVSVVGPARFGRYPVEVRELASPPPVPAWCEDVVEVSYAHSGGELVMGGFSDEQVLGGLASGSYRVRLCASGLDQAAVETEEDESQTYSSRHLFQIWPAPHAPDEVLRVGSTFAEEAHAGVRG